MSLDTVDTPKYSKIDMIRRTRYVPFPRTIPVVETFRTLYSPLEHLIGTSESKCTRDEVNNQFQLPP